MEYIATFYTHFGAIKYSKYLSGKNIPSETMPVPRKLSSSCGICVKFKTDVNISSIISEDMEKVFAINDSDIKQIYENK
mgnify:CR=1 FL=1